MLWNCYEIGKKTLNRLRGGREARAPPLPLKPCVSPCICRERRVPVVRHR